MYSSTSTVAASGIARSRCTDGVEVVWNRTEALIQQGAAGIVYGRNIIPHSHPDKITRALKAVVHDGLSAEEALKLLA